MASEVYIPKLVIVTWGEIIFKNFHDGDVIKAAHDQDATVETAGAQGDVAVTINAATMATVTITLQQVSPTNSLLAPLAASNRPRGRPLIMKPFTIKDLSDGEGGAFVFAEKAWIKKAADVNRGAQHGQCEWVFKLAEAIIMASGKPEDTNQ